MSVSRDELQLQVRAAFRESEKPNLDEITVYEDLDSKKCYDLFSVYLLTGEKEDLIALGVTSSEEIYCFSDKALIYFMPLYLNYLIQEKRWWEYCITKGMIEFMKSDKVDIFTKSQKLVFEGCLNLMKEEAISYELDINDF
jgi:hypothetical protein